MSTLLDQHRQAHSALAAVSTDAAAYQSLDDASLLQIVTLAAEEKRTAATHAALAAGVLAQRSDPSLGHAGLVQAEGFRSPAEFLRATTGATAREAATAVSIGTLVLEASDDLESARPWLDGVGHAVSEEGLSIAAAESISNGLGEPGHGVGADELAAAAALLCEEATSVDPDRLFKLAKELRNEIDEAGIADREAAAYASRNLRHFATPTGGRFIWDLDHVGYAKAVQTFDRATSPKRGGPRFAHKPTAAQAEAIEQDPRTPGQLGSDVFMQLIESGADADSSQLLGTGAPQVRILITESAFRRREGHGRLENGEPVSIGTVEHAACVGDVTEIVFLDSGQPLDVGYEQRLFTKKQRIALAARDGGCRHPDCDRPPSWTEAHHVQHWKKDKGKTDIANGILLCKFHHLNLHNTGREITRIGDQYWLGPPRHRPGDKSVLMPSKSLALKELVSVSRRTQSRRWRLQ
jgi:hypothetical protein